MSSVESTGGYVYFDVSNTVNTDALSFGGTGWTVVAAVYLNGVTGAGEFRSPISVRYFNGLGGGAQDTTLFELYQDESGTDLRLEYRDVTDTLQDILIKASAGGGWVHIAIVSDVAGSTGHIYAIDAGFNISSPSYLVSTTASFHQTNSGVSNGNQSFRMYTWSAPIDSGGVGGVDQGDQCLLGHTVNSNSVLTESQILNQFKSHTPTGEFSVFSYYACNNISTVGSDSSGNGHDGTLVSSGSFTLDTTLPVDWTAIEVAQEVDAFDSGFSVGTTLTATLTSVQAGSLLLAIYTSDHTAGSTASAADDTNTGSYTPFESVDDTGNVQKTGMLYFPNSLAGDITLTVTWSAGEFTKAVRFVELQNAALSGVLVGHNSQLQNTPGTGTDGLTSGTDTPTSQPALVYGFSFHEAGVGPSVGTGFVSGLPGWDAGQFSGLGARSEYLRITSTSAVAATFTAASDSSHVTFMGIFKELVTTPVTVQVQAGNLLFSFLD